MQVSGFTIVRNAELMGYPVVESIKSILPIVDEFVVGLGQSEDNTRQMIDAIGDPKIRIVDTFWDTRPSGGRILSEKTNEALEHCVNDWCLYLQCDEVIHERDLMAILNAMKKYEKDPDVHGLLFDYVHFYGSYNVVAQARNWYRREVRAIKKSTGIQSWEDAQGFRVDKEKPKVKLAHARVYHYGWVKPPQKMGQKKKLLDRLWHGNKKDDENDNFEFQKQYGLKPFTGVHPAVMRERIEEQDWDFNPKKPISDWSLKDLNYFASDVFERLFGHRIGEYKNYELMK